MSPEHIRAVPYPFSHIVSVDSDVDRQRPQHGALFHQFLNEQLGLAFGDSVWVHATQPGRSSFFLGQQRLNDRRAGVGTHTVYGLLLREWHRGNIDHFHSWTSDETFVLTTEVNPPVSLAEPAEVLVPPSELPVGKAPYEILRLWVKDMGNARLRVEIVTEEQSWEAVLPEAGRRISCDEGSQSWDVFELLASPAEGSRGFGTLKAVRVVPVQIGAARPFLGRVERDNFGRGTVEAQMATLEGWGVRPVYLSAHGGRSCAQNFGEARASAVRGERESASTVWVRPRADDSDSPYFHSDLLRKLGVEVVWPQLLDRWEEATHLYRDAFPNLKRWDTGRVYLSARTKLGVPGNWLAGSWLVREFAPAASATGRELRRWRGRFVRTMRAFDEDLEPQTLRRLFGSGVVRPSSHGSMFGLLIASSLARIRKGYRTVHLWYTHLGTLRDDYEMDEPLVFPEHIAREMRDLAHHAFGLEVPAAQRVWVPSTGTFLRYQLARLHVDASIAVQGDDVEVTPVWDPILERTWPDPAAGTRDLHGVTVYVADSARAKVRIGGRSCMTFTRNGPDETGRQSVTIVDDHAPKPIVDRVPVHALGGAVVDGGELVDVAEPGTGSAEKSLRLTASRRGLVSLTVRPNDLSLWNVTHMLLRYRLVAAPPTATCRFVLGMAAGHRVAALEQKGTHRPDVGAWWSYRALPSEEGWVEVCLATADLEFQSHRRFGSRVPLPLGRVEWIEVAMEGVDVADVLTVDYWHALRPCSDGVGKDGGVLVAGRVVETPGDRPLSDVTVRASWSSGGREARSDEHGYYFLEGTPKEVLELSAGVGARNVVPKQGRWIDVRHHETEVDFEVPREVARSTAPRKEHTVAESV